MRASLLDVNVLIALLDETHVHHRAAFEWFLGSPNRAWLTCPVTQMGAVRIMSSSRYGPGVVSPADVLTTLQQLTAIGHHAFVPDSVDLIATNMSLPNSGSVTDCYLLALAVKVDADLVTFDRSIPAASVRDGQYHLLLLDADPRP